MHDLSFDTPVDFLEPVRSLIGVTADELSDETIMSLSILGQAELDLLALVPDVKTILESDVETVLRKNQIMVGFVNLIAFYAYPSLKVSLLYTETDNKTAASRFRDALSRDPMEFKGAAIKALTQAGIVVNASPDIFSVVKPATDAITGA